MKHISSTKKNGTNSIGKKRRLVDEPPDEVFITKIVSVKSKILIIGRKCETNERVVITVSDCKPYLYYRDEDSTIVDVDTLKSRFKRRYSTIIPKEIIFSLDIVKAKPLKGYQEHKSLFLKITLTSDYNRAQVHRYIKEMKVLNIFESEITLKERFISDTDILPGKILRLPKIMMKHSLNVLSILYKKLISGKNLCYYNEKTPKNYIVSNFWLFQNECSKTKNENIPISWKWDKSLRNERFYENQQSFLEYSENPVILCFIQLYSAFSQKYKYYIFYSGSKNNFSKIQEKYKNDNNIRCFGYFRTNPKSSETNMLLNILQCLSEESDFVFGYKLLDPFYNNSMHYIYKRLIAMGCTKILYEQKHNYRRPTEIIMKKNNLLLYCNVVDLSDYGRSQFNNDIENNSVYNIMKTIKRKTFEEIGILLNREHGIQIIMDMCIENDKIMMQFITGTDSLILKTLERCTHSGGIDMNLIWNKQIQSRIYRMKMIHNLSLMKRMFNNDSYFIICCTENMHNNIKRHIVDRTDNSEGGRILPAKYKFVPSSTFVVDFDGFYYFIITALKLGYANIIFFEDDTINSDDYKNGQEILHGTIGNTHIGFVQNIYDERLPLVFLLTRLIKQRELLKRKIRMDQNNSFLIASEKAVKLMLVSVTGCLRSTFQFLFNCSAIGSVMCWIGRKIFDKACNISKKAFYNITKKEITNTSSASFNIRFEIISGHTDGFEMTLVDGDGNGLYCHEEDFVIIANKMKDYLEREIKNYKFDFVHFQKRKFESWSFQPKFKVESISKKTMFFHTNSKISEKYDGTFVHKATVLTDFRISKLEKHHYEKIIKNIFEKEEFSNDVEFYVKKFKTALTTRNDLRWSDIVRYEQQTEHMRKSKQKINENRNSNIGSSSILVTRMLRKYQQHMNFPIPDTYDHIGYIFSTKEQIGIIPVHMNEYNTLISLQSINSQKYIQLFRKYVTILDETMT